MHSNRRFVDSIQRHPIFSLPDYVFGHLRASSHHVLGPHIFPVPQIHHAFVMGQFRLAKRELIEGKRDHARLDLFLEHTACCGNAAVKIHQRAHFQPGLATTRFWQRRNGPSKPHIRLIAPHGENTRSNKGMAMENQMMRRKRELSSFENAIGCESKGQQSIHPLDAR